MRIKIISGCLAALLLFSLSGCRFIDTPGVGSYEITSSEVTSAQIQKEYAAEEAKKYLKEKYPDDDFTYVSARSPVWGADYFEVIFKSQKYDQREVTVYLTKLDEITRNDGSSDIDYEISDSYFTCVFRDEGIQYFDKLLTDAGLSNYILDIDFINTIASSENVEIDKDFYYNYQNHKVLFYLYLFTDSDISRIESKLETVLDSEKQKGLNLWLEYVYFEDLSVVNEYRNKESIRDVVIESKEYIMYSTFYKKEKHYKSN